MKFASLLKVKNIRLWNWGRIL